MGWPKVTRTIKEEEAEEGGEDHPGDSKTVIE